jgi:hypothetical protein
MFEVIVARMGLSIRGLDQFDFDLASMNPFAQKEVQILGEQIGNDSMNVSGYNAVNGEQPVADANNSARNDFPSYPGAYTGEGGRSYETMMRGEDPERWFNELFSENVLGMNSTPLWYEWAQR